MTPYSGNSVISFKSVQTSYRQVYLCKIDPSDYNLTYNQTIIDQSGSLYNFASGSDFRPYATSVGIYDDEQNLLAVAKLTQPIMISPTTQMTIQVNLDW